MVRYCTDGSSGMAMLYAIYEDGNGAGSICIALVEQFGAGLHGGVNSYILGIVSRCFKLT